jgi:hypothetical protein
MAKNLREKITKLEEKNIELSNKNQELLNQIELEKKQNVEIINNIQSEHEQKYNELETVKDAEIEKKNKSLEVKDELLTQKQLQLDQKEIKKLSQAYHDQEVVYQKVANKWLIGLIILAILLAVSAVVSVVLSHGKVWYERFEYYLADVVLLSAVWFCASQYSDSIKLKNDYANRKTIAQSFSNILHNLQEDDVIKNKFIEKATDVLCLPTVVSTKESVITKEALKQIVEIGKIVSGK